jgi:hypothetical protein
MTGKQSTKAQQVSPAVWYYENGRHLEFYVRLGGEGVRRTDDSGQTIAFDVRLDMLEASIARAPRRGTK